ncbi:MAG: tagaturonate epimerase family protein [Bacteroidota bacterium]
MNDLAAFLAKAAAKTGMDALRNAASGNPYLYPASIQEHDGTVLFLAKTPSGKKLFAVGDGAAIYHALEGTVAQIAGTPYKECGLTVENSRAIRGSLPYTAPIPLTRYDATIGLGDRLGLASPGHVRLIKGMEVKPVLAQQSIRELNLTGRDYGQVLADATWAVFQEGYRGGYGADGDHLKTYDEIRMALAQGFTMITLDCSEYIRRLAADDRGAIGNAYASLAAGERMRLEKEFVGQAFVLSSGLQLRFSADDLKLNAAVYQEAVNFAIAVYRDLIQPVADRVDFEVSIDETATPTQPLAHFYVAKQLLDADVRVNSMAPRFCGEFQKGIDYIGDITQFEREYVDHQKIAEHFGYKLSIHSGSDKFSVFPIIGRISKGRIHVKTAGTNWLEAVKVIIHADPGLYRELHAFALEKLAEAKKYYHISAEPARIPDLRTLSDRDLQGLMAQNDARQVIHITYGLILQARDDKGNFRFRDRIYRCLSQHEELFYEYLQAHIGKHLSLLGLK